MEIPGLILTELNLYCALLVEYLLFLVNCTIRNVGSVAFGETWELWPPAFDFHYRNLNRERRERMDFAF